MVDSWRAVVTVRRAAGALSSSSDSEGMGPAAAGGAALGALATLEAGSATVLESVSGGLENQRVHISCAGGAVVSGWTRAGLDVSGASPWPAPWPRRRQAGHFDLDRERARVVSIQGHVAALGTL